MADVDPLAMELPAPFVNQFQILVAGTNVRLSFAEGFKNQISNYRAAVMMSEADARELAIAILGSLQGSALNPRLGDPNKKPL